MKHRLLRAVSLILTLSLLLNCAPWTFAAEAEVSWTPVEAAPAAEEPQAEVPVELLADSTTEDGFTYTVSADAAAITGYTGESTEPVIPAELDGLPVKTIRSDAFRNRSDLTAVTLPETLTAVGSFAFSNCDGLSEIILPEGITSLGHRAFGNIETPLTVHIPTTLSGCDDPFADSVIEEIVFADGITAIAPSLFPWATLPGELAIPETVTSLGKYAFANVRGLETVILPDGITEIPSHCFYRAGSLKSVTIPENLTKIGEYAFDTTALTEIDIPETVTSIGNLAFSNCDGLSEIILPEGITTLGNRAFGYIDNPLTVHIPTTLSGCDDPFADSVIEEIVFADGITAIAPSLFPWATLPGELTIPETVTSLGKYAFANVRGLETVILPDGITEIPSHCFYRAGSLKSVTLPNTLTKIKDYAFDTTALTEIAFPETLTVIENFAFSKCVGLTEIILPEGVTTLGHRTFGYLENPLTVHIPTTLVNDCDDPFGDSVIENVVFAAGLTTIAPALFSWAILPEALTLPDTVTTLGSNAFENAKGLESIVLSDGITEISSHCFYRAGSLKSVTLPETLTRIRDYAFDTTALTEIAFPETLTVIENFAFSKCVGLTEIILPEGVTTLGHRVFGNIETPLTVQIPTSLVNDCDGPFGGSVIENIVFAEGITTIAPALFSWATLPEALTLPDTVTTLGSNAFENAKGLESIVLPDGITEISSHCFYRAGSLQSVTLPETLTRIRDYAFDTTALTEIHFPETLTAIDNFAFSKCVGLTEIVLPEGVTTLGHRVFGNIETPLTVHIPTTLVNDCDGPFGGSIIENIVFAEDITAIAPALFSWATLPKALTLPDTVTKLGSHAFENTKGLESIVLPDGITEIPSHCFYRAASLASVRLPNTLTNIRDYAFDTTALTEIDFPETLTAIENFAFSNCDSLTAVSLPAALTALGHQVFGNSAELTTLHCAADRLTMDGNLLGGSPKAEVSASDRSDLSRHAIEANLPLRLYTGTGDRTLLTADSDYRINANSAVSGNLVTLTVDFAFREPDRIRQARLDLWIPGNTVLVESTLLLNGAPAQQIDYDGDYTCIEIPKSGGTLQFCLRITEPGDIRTLACVNTNLGSEIVRVLSAPLPEVTMNTAERTSAAAITVTGIARADAPVTVYVDGVEAAQATANKAGSYSVHLTLPDVQDNRTYTVEARSGSASAARQVLYLTTTPILTEFLMYYNNHQNTCLDLLAHQDHRPSLPFNPSYAITLTAGFENGDEIETVWFTSSRNGTKKYFEAAFDGERYVAVLTRTDYTGDPGTLAVEYELRDKDLSMSSLASQMEEALAQCAQLPELEGRIKLREAELASTMIPLDGLVLVNSVAADMDLSPNLDGTSGLSMALKVYNYDPASNVSAALNPVVSPSLLLPGALGLTAVHRGNGSPLTGQFLPAINGQTLRFSTTDPETGKTYNVTFLNNTGYDDDTPYETTREVYAFVEDVSGSEIVEFAIDYAFGDSAEKFLSGMGDVSQTLGIINNLLEANDIQTDYDRMVQEIYRTVPPDQQEAALKEARRIRSGRSDYLAGTVVMGAMFSYMASAGLFAGPAGVAMAAMMMAIALSGKYLSKYSPDSILGSLFGAKWIQDPSGYVYEAVTTNRVEGVAATAFWIAEPEDADQAELEAFYAAKPDDARAGVPWNAVEYDQLNPLLTDSNGAYAWDVPCGWWQVRFEKDGYETTCSDWLPVPPPQLEVNVPIVSFEAPVMETVRAETDAVEVTFSKYMRPETVKDALTLNGQAVSVSWPTHETAADGTVYARTFTITPAAALPLGSTATVAVTDGARSYAGTPAVSAAVEAPVGGAPRLELRSLVRVSRDSTARVPFTLTNADPAALQVRCEPAALAEVTLDAQTGQLTVRGKLPGAATVTLWSEEAGLAETMEVRVEQVSAPVDPALNNPQWDSAAGTLTVTAVCDSDATVAAAVYSAAGQFLGLRIAPVVSGDSITLRNLPQGETCTVFLLDSLTHEPLCKAAGRHNTIE